MNRLPPWKTVHGRLLCLAIVLEALMLTLLIANSLRLLHNAMADQVQAQAKEISPILIAALTAPMAQRDYATIRAVLAESLAADPLEYIVVLDRYGNRLFANEFLDYRSLPQASGEFSFFALAKDPVYHVVKPIEYMQQPLGELHFGLNLTRILHARRTLLIQGMSIAALEIMLSSLVLVLLGFWITRHMQFLTRASLEVAAGNFPLKPLMEGDNDVGKLSAAFNIMSRAIQDRVRELTQTNNLLEEKQLQLEQLNQSLQERVRMTVAELRSKDQLLINQGRQAAMGEMIGNIAHQWRQPLNTLALVLTNIHDAHEDGELTAEYLAGCITTGNRLLQKMSSTINDFRDFFLPNKVKMPFSAEQQIRLAIEMVAESFAHNHIKINLAADQECILFGFPNEYSQVLLNLLNNAKEAITDAARENGQIHVTLTARQGMGVVTVEDNGGGIPKDILDKIFDPYFSTKPMGTGIGLYMSKTIIERNMQGRIEARNNAAGSNLSVMVPLAYSNLHSR
ncbi:MAG: HAMP domain-containing sensor histidine kinase [Desulfobulbus sp.]|nr:HAMP domain-containing sensor histidine kinase [Desulfobulbus sp.]